LHPVRHRTKLKNRIHATLITLGHPCPVSDLFGLAGRELLDKMAIPDPWRRNVDVSLGLIDDLELQFAQLTVMLKRLGADHRYIPLLVTGCAYASHREGPRGAGVSLGRPATLTSSGSPRRSLVA
jgi:transposase